MSRTTLSTTRRTVPCTPQYKKLADAEPGVIFGGRLGEYKYYDMDKVIEVALSVAENELA